ncbi:MAG: thiol peroxidase [Desulfovibrio sp.]|jgi:thiol peroxidase|nr:thiol peroxidase [Desulfovibrio sp.]
MLRTGVITFQGNPLTLLGNAPAMGKPAPDFSVLDNALQKRTLADYKGKTIIFSVVPSLDTPVCDMQTRHFNNKAAALGEKIRILAVSCDLPFAQARWCGAAGISRVQTLSDHYDLSFGLAYGVAIKELRLLTRSIFVVNGEGVLTYQEVVPEVTHEVNFAAALAAAEAALK